MKILILFLSVLTATAQTPTLKNFNRQHFLITTNGATTNIIKTRLSSTNFDFNTFNITNIGGPTYNTTINGPITFTTNSTSYFAGPIYYITGGTTNIFTFSPQVFTNSAGTIRPLATQTGMEITNLYSYQTLNAMGSFNTVNQSIQTIGAGTNVVPTFNNAMVYLVSTVTNGAYITLNVGNGAGEHLWIINVLTNSTFTLNSGALNDDITKQVYVRGGSWTPTELGESLELIGVPGGWIEQGRSNPNGPVPLTGTNYWFNLSDVVQNIDTSTPDGSPSVRVKVYSAHTTGNLFEVENFGTNVARINYDGSYFGGRPGKIASFTVAQTGELLLDTSIGEIFVRPATGYAANIGENDQLRVETDKLRFSSRNSIGSGNLLEVGNNTTNKHTIAWNGAATFGDFLVVTNNASNEAVITAPLAGLELVSGSGWGIGFSPSGNYSWQFSTAGDLLPNTTDTHNIGIYSENGVVFPPDKIAANWFIIHQMHTPASSAETNYLGAIAFDASYFYVWTATNVNKRVALSTW